MKRRGRASPRVRLPSADPFFGAAPLEVEPNAVLHVFNCHLGLAARERSFQRKQMLSEAILLSKDLHHPVILMGDFNDRPIPVVHRSLRSHFMDAYQDAGKFWGPTFKAGQFPFVWTTFTSVPALRPR